MIQETIVTTRAAGHTQIVPLGVRHEGELLVLAPFRPSATLDLLLASRCAVVNYTDDVRIFAGALTGRYDWPTLPARHVACARLANCLAHTELSLERVEDDGVRPRLLFRPVHEEMHAPFRGFNRAQAAVIEAAILVSRLDMLSREKVDDEMRYLRIAIDKTAGTREREAWEWLCEAIARHRSTQEPLQP